MNIACYAILVVVSFFCLAPILWMVATSFLPETANGEVDLAVLMKSLTFQNYASVWRQSHFPELVTNSVLVNVFTLGICFSSGILAAYALSRFEFRGKGSLMVCYLLVRMLPPAVLAVPLYIVLKSIGLLDTRIGLALSYTSFVLPNFVWMARTFFDAVPVDLEDAARIDGASRLGALVRIALPIAAPGLAGTTAFVAVLAWNEFVFALMFTTSLGSRTWPVGLQLMIGEFQLPWGLLAATGVLSVLPVVLLLAVFGRRLGRRMLLDVAPERIVRREMGGLTFNSDNALPQNASENTLRGRMTNREI
jgi:multiple sugar transport system permease protein